MTTTLKEAKKYLVSAGVDFSDCLERSELLERFRAVRLTRESSEIERTKLKANAAFRRQSLEFAIRQYTLAALATCALHKIDAQEAVKLMTLLLANRSQALLQLQLPLRALRDARQCVRLDPSYVKGHARLAAAHLAIGQPHRAVARLKRALQVAADAPEQQTLLHAQMDAALAAQAAAEEAAHVAGDGAGGVAPDGGTDAPATTDDEEAAGASLDAAAEEAGLAREASVQAECVLLHSMEEDVLALVMCHLQCARDLSAAAATCRALRRAVGSATAVAEGGCWHSLCMATWPELSAEVAARHETLRADASEALGAMAIGGGERAGEAAALGLDWHVLYRERVRHRAVWSSGSASISVIGEHRGPIYGCRLGRGDVLLSSSEDSTLVLWDLATRKPIRTCEGHDHGILGAWLEADGTRAVSGGFDATIRVWALDVDMPKAKCLRVIAGRKHARPPAHARTHMPLAWPRAL